MLAGVNLQAGDVGDPVADAPPATAYDDADGAAGARVHARPSTPFALMVGSPRPSLATPADVAWQIPAHRKTIGLWLDAWPDEALNRLAFDVVMVPLGERTAIFLRELRNMSGGLEAVVAVCSLRGTIYAGRQLRVACSGCGRAVERGRRYAVVPKCYGCRPPAPLENR